LLRTSDKDFKNSSLLNLQETAKELKICPTVLGPKLEEPSFL
jgi:hypothetical protein